MERVKLLWYFASNSIAALWKLAADMYSGGFDEFFLNWGYDCYSYAMRGIKRIADANSGLKRAGCFSRVHHYQEYTQNLSNDKMERDIWYDFSDVESRKPEISTIVSYNE